jgi:hypothetical protein
MKPSILGGLCVGIALWAMPTAAQQTLNVSVQGSGKVTGSGIDCPRDCSETMLPTYIGLRPRPVAPVAVVLTAHPNEGNRFLGWSSPCPLNPEPTCTVSVPAGGLTISARFGPPITFSVLRVTVVGGGTVTGTNISCPYTCARPSFSPFTMTLTATPQTGHIFMFWTNGCTGSTPTCTVSVSGQKDVFARFEAVP